MKSAAIKSITTALVLLTSMSAGADRIGENGQEFISYIELINEVPDLTTIEHRKLPPKLTQKLKAIADSQANIWADTILEGDYEADNEISLDLVESIYNRGERVAFRITYSAKSWETSSCNYDYENKETLAECAEGRISESTYVSPDLQTWTRDENAYAEFSD
ncbi:MAG: hypothetical protein V4692_13215 [Bdellovibrionota bacterium]